jgi:enhancing lycopene biosynthesis protein 2
MCIAPVILAKLLPGVEITLGGENDAGAAATKMGAVVKTTTHGEVIVDEAKRVATTPSYMLDDASVQDIHACATNLLGALAKML